MRVAPVAPVPGRAFRRCQRPFAGELLVDAQLVPGEVGVSALQPGRFADP
jgi:hypothetical protein